MVSASRQVCFRLFVEAPLSRSADLAAALVRRLASYGTVEVRESGAYWKIPEYLELNVELTAHDTASTCIDHLQALEPAGWSGDVWNYRPEGPPFLFPEVRWAWLAVADE